jgi:hypothetical protein
MVDFLLQNSPSAEVDYIDCTKKPLRPRRLWLVCFYFFFPSMFIFIDTMCASWLLASYMRPILIWPAGTWLLYNPWWLQDRWKSVEKLCLMLVEVLNFVYVMFMIFDYLSWVFLVCSLRSNLGYMNFRDKTLVVDILCHSKDWD